MRLRLTVLGPVNVTMDGGEPGPRLTQPRLLALLAYLALARPRGLHSRDTLLALLWPDADQPSGRQNLRNALHRLRSALGEGVIVTAGESFVGIEVSHVDCDVLSFEEAIAQERWSDAVAAYRGELLQGFHVSGAPEFERWVDAERARLTSAAVAATWSDAETRRKRGDISGALHSARRACEMTPDDEPSLRRYLDLLDHAGDRPGAVRAYEDFARRLKTDYDVQPSGATQSLIAGIRAASVTALGRANAATGQRVPHTHIVSASNAIPSAQRRSRLAALSLALGLILLPALWLSMRVSPTTDESSNAPGAELPARWRADTALLNRYLRAEALLSSRKTAESRDAFRQLANDAPRYAPAWAGLGMATYLSAFEDIPPVDAMTAARAAAERALALDGTLARALEVMVAYELWGRWDLPAARRLLDSALTMHPEDRGLNNILATWHRWRGDFDSSLDLKRWNASVDPLTPRSVYQLAPSLYFAHRCDEAVDEFQRIPREVRTMMGGTILYRSLVCSNQLDDAAMVLRDALLAEGDSVMAAALNPPLTPARRATVSRQVFRKRLAREFDKRRRAWSPPEHIMRNYAELQIADSTLVWLDSMYVEKSMMLYVVPFDPLMDFLRGDRRFDAFLHRLPWIVRATSDIRPQPGAVR